MDSRIYNLLRPLAVSMVAILSAVSTVPIIQSPAFAAPNDNLCELIGQGTESSPYLVATVDDVLEIPDCDETGVHFEQFQDIDLRTVSAPIPEFQGNYDGNGYRLSHLTLSSTDEAVGLFGMAFPGSSFQNVTLSAFSITATDPSADAGSLLGFGWGVSLLNVVVIDARVTSSSNAGGIVGELSEPDQLAYLVVRNSVVKGDASIGGIAGDLLTREDRTFSQILVQETVLERTSPPVNDQNYLGGLFGEIVVAGESDLSLIEVGFNGQMFPNRVDANPADNANQTLTGGLIGRMSKTASQDEVNLSVVASGVIAEVENEGTASNELSGIVYELDDIPLTVDFSFLSATVRQDLSDPASGLSVIPYRGTNVSPATLDVQRSFVDSSKATISGAATLKTTAELKDPATYIAANYNIEQNLDRIYNNTSGQNTGFLTPEVNGGFPAFAWASEHYGPTAYFNGQISNGYLLPDISFNGLKPDNEYTVTVQLKKTNNTVVPIQLSSDDHTGLPQVFSAGTPVVDLWGDSVGYQSLSFNGLLEEIRSATWRVFVDPLQLGGETVLNYSVDIEDHLSGLTVSATRSVEVLACDFPSAVNAGYSAVGTSGDPYVIDSVSDLPMVGQCMGPGKFFELSQDLDFAGLSHTPIGHDALKFSSTFDGKGHSISGLFLDEIHREDQGFFGEFGDRLEPPVATIKNLTITGEVTGRVRAGVLVGDTDNGRFENINVFGEVFADNTAALLTADAEHLYADNISLSGNVTVKDQEAGLLAADVTGTYLQVSNVVASGRVVGEDYAIGGLIGGVDSTGFDGSSISDVVMNIDIQIRLLSEFVDNNDVGGLVGESYNTRYENIEVNPLQLSGQQLGRVASLARSGVDYDSNNFGGAFGSSSSDVIVNVISRLDVVIEEANDGDDETGGLIGEAEGSFIDSSAAFGNVTGFYEVGGLIGELDNPGGPRIVRGSQAYGDVSGHERVGGLIGFAEAFSDNLKVMSITDSSAYGEVTGVASGFDDDFVGGLIGGIRSGNPDFVFSGNSYSGPGVIAPDHGYVGGLVGSLDVTGENATVANNSVATTIEGFAWVGGFAGYVEVASSYLEFENLQVSLDLYGGDDSGGLFGAMASTSSSEIFVTDVNVSGLIESFESAADIGGLFGKASVEDSLLEVTDAQSNVNVSTDAEDVGGLVGDLTVEMGSEVLITNSKALGSTEGDDYVGGFFGYVSLRDMNTVVRVVNSAAEGDVTALSGPAGGFLGDLIAGQDAEFELMTTFATGDVLGGDDYIGGFQGSIYASGDASVHIQETLASGNVSGSANIGGHTGWLNTATGGTITIERSAALGDVSATNSGPSDTNVGGFMGFGGGIILDSYASGNVAGNDYAGGFFGQVRPAAQPDQFATVYASGAVSSQGDYVGGFAGDVHDENLTLSAYYFVGEQGSVVAHADNVQPAQARGLTLEEINQPGSFLGWDIQSGYDPDGNSVWVMCPAFHDVGPTLRWILEITEIENCSLGSLVASPFDGPVVASLLDPTSREILDVVQPNQEVLIVGRNLEAVSALAADSKEFSFVSVTSEEIRAVVPKELRNGQFDLELTSGRGTLIVQGLLRVQQSPVSDQLTFTAWTSLKGDYVKMYAKNPVSFGKVQFFVNGREVAWIRAVDSFDRKLRNTNGFSYLVRSVELAPGKNRFEVHLNGERVWRATYLGE